MNSLQEHLMVFSPCFQRWEHDSSAIVADGNMIQYFDKIIKCCYKWLITIFNWHNSNICEITLLSHLWSLSNPVRTISCSGLSQEQNMTFCLLCIIFIQWSEKQTQQGRFLLRCKCKGKTHTRNSNTLYKICWSLAELVKFSWLLFEFDFLRRVDPLAELFGFSEDDGCIFLMNLSWDLLHSIY